MGELTDSELRAQVDDLAQANAKCERRMANEGIARKKREAAKEREAKEKAARCPRCGGDRGSAQLCKACTDRGAVVRRGKAHVDPSSTKLGRALLQRSQMSKRLRVKRRAALAQLSDPEARA